MRKINRIHSNRYLGSLPEGCKLCMKGAKLVLFITGICPRGCFYCPLSERRRGRDVPWANERRVERLEDVLLEAERMEAEGAGITGGSVDLRLKRALGYMEALKGRFGPAFHIHMYTANPLGVDTLRELKGAGLDELRFHVTGEEIWETIAASINLGIETGIEVPVLPGGEGGLVALAERLESIGGSFLNLNELEFSDTNAPRLKRRGWGLKAETSNAVLGSEESALRVLEACRGFGITVHYCSSSYKDAVQLRRRLLRTARNVAKGYEEVSRDGLLLKGTIIPQNPTPERLLLLMETMRNRFKIPEGLMAIDGEKGRLETTLEIAERLSRLYRRKDLRYALVEEYPTADRLETEVFPL